MSVDAKKFLSYVPPDRAVTFNRRDLILYALGVNATDLRFTNEADDNFGAFPTFYVVLPFRGTSFDVVPFGVDMADRFPGIEFDPSMILHGEQTLEILRHPLPTEGNFVAKSRSLGLYDKGKGVVIPSETTLCTQDGKPFVKMVSSTFIRGIGGYGGDKGPNPVTYNPPNRPPDAVEEEKTVDIQAQLYRLSGDYNQLHINPVLAQMVGFSKPILHGLCSFGIAARSIIKALCNNDPTKFKSISVRFVSPVYPGETLVTEMWREGSKVLFQTSVKERKVKVLGNCYAELFESSSKL